MTYPNEEHCSGTMFQEKSRLYYIIVDTVNNRENFLDSKTMRRLLWQKNCRISQTGTFEEVLKSRLLLEDF